MDRILFCLLLNAVAMATAGAAEIEGRVAKVKGKTIVIHSLSEFLPAVGDRLEVFVEIPGVGKASVATGTVSSIDSEAIVAMIDKATGTTQSGQLVTIDAPQPTKRTRPPSRAASWGTATDPDGDCTIRENEGALSITVPAGHHDLWYGGAARFNAPRSLQEVEGDFTAQVRVSADQWDPEVARSKFHYHAGGLILWDSRSHYLRHERNFMYNDAIGEICHATPLYDREKQRMNGWKCAPADFFQGKSTWLRIARTGKTVVSSISHDGEKWLTTSVLTTEFPDKVQLGVHAIGISPRALNVVFDSFTIARGSPQQPPAAKFAIPIPGWGDAFDADQDCTMIASHESLRLTVPPGVHDLWYQREHKNAPQVVRDVEGDFVAQVKVTADCLGPIAEAGGMARCAGLVVYESDDHYLRVERNRYIPRNDTRNASWYPPLYDRDGERQTAWKATLDKVFPGKSTWLRVARSGQDIVTEISQDGRTWTRRTVTTTSFPERIKVGLLAINNSSEAFDVKFEDFQLQP